MLQLVEVALQVQGLLLSNRMSKMPGVVSFGGEGRMAPALVSGSRPATGSDNLKLSPEEEELYRDIDALEQD